MKHDGSDPDDETVEAYPFIILDPAGVLHTLGLIEDDADWTDCEREIGKGWYAVDFNARIDPTFPRCPECSALSWQHS